MGLSSVFSTAISGLQASETIVDVAGNNVANSNTVGYKAAQVMFVTQFLQTLGLGSAPSASNGGTNPRQVGLGAQVSSITPDFSQGTLQISSNPSDLAIQGDGFFMVKATTGEEAYTRDGQFRLNSSNELTTLSGERLLGYGVDNDYNVQSTQLVALSIPLGSAAVAKATENVKFQGTLPPTGDVADQAAIIQSGVLSDAQFVNPNPTTQTVIGNVPSVALSVGTSSNGAGNLTPGDVYQYKVVYADKLIAAGATAGTDAYGTESVASAALSVTVGAGHDQIDLSSLPSDSTNTYAYKRIYRTDANGSSFKLLTELTNATTTYSDQSAAFGSAPAGSALSTASSSTLTGNYSYYVTYASSTGGPGIGTESRPSLVVGPTNVVAGRVQLKNIPAVPSDPNFNQATTPGVRRIYRNSATNPDQFHFVGEITDMSTTTFTDSVSEATWATRPAINLNGPIAKTNTKLVDLLQRGDTQSTPLFTVGTLNFTGKKGGRTLETKSLTIDANTDVNDLINFYNQALGIHREPGVPSDSSGSSPGGSVTADGRIQLVSNNGTDNAVTIDTSSLTETVSSGATTQINMSFAQTQAAKGGGAVADFIVYDSLGIPMGVRVTTELESRTDTTSTYRWFADSKDNDPLTGVGIAVGTGQITFDSQGHILSVNNSTVSIDRKTLPSASPAQFELDFSGLSGLAANQASLSATEQDGFPPGKLTSYIIGEDGIIKGVFDNGTQRTLGAIQLVRFANPDGLEQRGHNLYAPGVNSGLPVQGNPAQSGLGSIVSGAIELSNTDISKSLINLITASTSYRGNARVITAAQQLLEELLNLR